MLETTRSEIQHATAQHGEHINKPSDRINKRLRESGVKHAPTRARTTNWRLLGLNIDLL